MNVRPPRFAVDIAVAFQFLTRLPIKHATYAEDGLARSVKFFPLVGLVIGSGAVLLERVLAPHLDRTICALVVLVYLMLITGCLHEDGLADVADSMGGWSFEQRLTILRDSRLGTFGAAALTISLLARVALLARLPIEHFTTYVLSAHILCRWSTLPLSYYLPPARLTEGQGARVAGLTSSASLIAGSAFTIVAVVVALHKASIAPLLSSLLVVVMSSLFYMRKFGGITGDCFGATNQLTELAVYLCGVWKP
jgi:adenosylcobinamide-GDP ribazoletransferase